MFAKLGELKRASIWTLSVALLLGLAGVTRVKAQGAMATILGTVTDSSGASVPNAKIEVKNLGTGVMLSVTTDAQGRYSVPQLPIGQYQIQATASGFQTMVRSGLTLTVGSQTVADFALRVGQTQQTVTVESQVQQVETTSTALGGLVEPTQMRDMPLNGRNFSQLITLTPGVVQQAGGQHFYGGQQNYSVSGSRPEGQAFLLDNTDVQNFWMHGTGSGALGTSLGIDAIAEFQTLTNTYSAQYGGNGAVVNAVTRSGTNNFHGSAYEFFRNNALDAPNHFDNGNIPPFRRNQFGGTLGGPIKKDKAFFFANYEAVRQLFGQSFPAFVPDTAARQGYLPTGPGGALVGVQSGCPAYSPSLPVGTCVAPNVVSTLALYPTAPAANEIVRNGLPTGIAQVTQVGNQVGSENYGISRLDYNFSEKDSMFLRYGVDQANLVTPNAATAPVPLWPETDTTFNHYVTFQEKHIVSNNVINLATFSYVRTNEHQFTSGSTPPLQFFSTSPQNGNVSVTGLSSIGANNLLPSIEIQNRFSIGDDVVWSHGAHSMTFGMSVERIQDNSNAPLFIGGNWSFNSLAQFLGTGKGSLVLAPVPGQADAAGYLRELLFAPYFQDSWKVTSRLTLNIGLRWEPTINPGEVGHPMYALTQTPLGINGAINPGPFAFQQVQQAFGNNPSTMNFDPRFGFAFDPFSDHKTVIRGGFGIFHDVITARSILPGYWLNPPYAIGAQPAPLYGPNPVVGNTPISQAQGIAYQSGSTPYMMQYNLNIQRQIGSDTILTVGYVGSQGRHLMMMNDLNPPVNTGTVDNPILGHAGPNPCTAPGVPTGCSDVAVSNVRLQPAGQAIPGNILSNLSYLSNRYPGGSANYNSLQTSLNHRFSHNFQTQISYTYAKSLDYSSLTYALEGLGNSAQNIENPYNSRIDYGRSTFDRTHTFLASGLYQFPFKGNKFVEGWQMSGILTATSGPPFTVFDGFDRAGLSENSASGERPNVVPGCSANPVVGKVTQWYNPSCFALQPVGTLGNLGRDTLVGPGFTNFDYALMKTTPIPKISEDFAIQFRAEFFDILNHPNYNFPNGGGQSVFTSSGAFNPVAAVITSTAGNEVVGGAQRVIQFGLKILF